MANHISSKHYLHKSIIWELGLLTHYLQAEGKKRTGIQLIRVSDANGNVYQRYYDFDKGEFASNPNKDMPKEELKKYRGLRNKDISNSIASLTYTSSFEGEEEVLWKEVDKELEDLSPEQEVETQSLLTQLTATNSGWSIGMQILGDEVALGFEDGLKSIEANLDKGLSATGTALNNLWQGINDNKPLRDGILLAGALMGSVASAVKGFSILGGGFEGLATKPLLAGVGLEFTAAALGSFFVGKAIKTFVMPKIEEWKKNHPPKSDLEKTQERIKQLQSKTEDNQKKQLLKDLKNDPKEIIRSIKNTDEFIQGLAFSEISWSQQSGEETEERNEKANNRKVDTTKGFQKFNPYAYAINLGINNANSLYSLITKGTKKHAYQDLLAKVNNKELLLEDGKKVEALATELTEHEKTLDKREEDLNKLGFEPKDKTPLLEQINEGRSAIASKKLELYAAMFTENELVRETDNRDKIIEILHNDPTIFNNGAKQLRTATGYQLENYRERLDKAKNELGAKKLNERNYQIPDEEPKELAAGDYRYLTTLYKNALSFVQTYEQLVKQHTFAPGYEASLKHSKAKLQELEEVGKVMEELETAPELNDLREELNKIIKTMEAEATTMDNISIDYKQKLEALVGNLEATPEEIQEVAPDFIDPPLPQ